MGRYPGEKNGNPLQYSCLKNTMDRGAGWGVGATVHGVAKSWTWLSNEIKRHLLLGRKVMTSLDSILKSRDITLPTKVYLVKAMAIFRSHVCRWELDHKEGWALKNWCFRTVVLENTFESPLDFKQIQQVHPNGNHSWIFIERTDVKAEAPILWPPDAKSPLGKIEGRKRRGWQRTR